MEVEPWLARCRRVVGDPSYDLAGDLELPVPLPTWVVVEDYPVNHLTGLAHAAQEVGSRAAAALGAVLAAGDPPDGGASRITAAQGLVAAADSAVASVRPLLASLTDSEELRELVAVRLQDALALYFEMGQRLRLPARSRTPPSRSRALITLAAPGEPGFDLWCLTAPEVAARLGADKQAQQALHRLWRFDPDPRQTLALQARLLAAVRDGMARRAVDDEGTPGSLHTCPWPPVYEAARTLRLGGRRLRPLTHFALEVSASQLNGAAFVRRVVTGPFSSTSRLRYSRVDDE